MLYLNIQNKFKKIQKATLTFLIVSRFQNARGGCLPALPSPATTKTQSTCPTRTSPVRSGLCSGSSGLTRLQTAPKRPMFMSAAPSPRAALARPRLQSKTPTRTTPTQATTATRRSWPIRQADKFPLKLTHNSMNSFKVVDCGGDKTLSSLKLEDDGAGKWRWEF